MATTLATLRSSLQRKTDSQLTTSGDQDIYLVLGEKHILRNWMKFDPGRFREARETDTTDANGIMIVDIDTTRIERIEDANKVKYNLIDDINDRWSKTGYYVAGYDTTNKTTQLQVMKNGAVAATQVMYYYDTNLGAMATSTSTSESIIPEEYRDAIAKSAAYHYYQDQGPQFAGTANYWKGEVAEDMAEARRLYKNYSRDPAYMGSNDPDAGGASAFDHVVS